MNKNIVVSMKKASLKKARTSIYCDICKNKIQKDEVYMFVEHEVKLDKRPRGMKKEHHQKLCLVCANKTSLGKALLWKQSLPHGPVAEDYHFTMPLASLPRGKKPLFHREACKF